MANYIKKGRLIGVCGRLEIKNYEKEGVKKYIREVVAEEVQFLDWGNKHDTTDGIEYHKIVDDDILF